MATSTSAVGRLLPAISSLLRPPPAGELREYGGVALVRRKRVIDIGCGDGRMALGCAPHPSGVIATSHEELVNDRSSDDAVATAVGSGWFRSRGAGRFWHRVLFEDRPTLQRYLDDHARFVHRVRWMVDPATRRRWDEDPWAI